MSEQAGGRLGFLDALGKLFGGRRAAEANEPAPAPDRFGALEKDFESAIARVNQQIEERRRASAVTATNVGESEAPKTAQQRAAERAQRVASAQQAMREDIEKRHAELGTGLSSKQLTELAAFLQELHATTVAGKGSQTLIPRARYAIGEKLRAEAGELAVERLVALLERGKKSWPDPTYYGGSATAEEIERSRRRRLGDVKDVFLGASSERTAERMLGVVQGWGGDYPERGTPLWEECALEGVAAGIRAQLLKEFVEVLRESRDALLGQLESAIGKEIAAVQALLKTGVDSIDDASRAVAGPFRVIDEVAPKLAWEHIQAKLPSARGATPAAR